MSSTHYDIARQAKEHTSKTKQRDNQSTGYTKKWKEVRELAGKRGWTSYYKQVPYDPEGKICDEETDTRYKNSSNVTWREKQQ